MLCWFRKHSGFRQTGFRHKDALRERKGEGQSFGEQGLGAECL